MAEHSRGEEITAGLSREEVSNLIYPIGAEYISFTDTNPSSLKEGKMKYN